MNNKDFLININSSIKLEENNINFNSTNTYSCFLDKNELEKISLHIENNISYISCFFSSKDDKLTNLADGCNVLLFIKSPKILYGIIKVESILLKDIPEKSYLDDTESECITEIINHKSIEINSNKYNNLIKKYKYVEVPKMFLLKFKNLYSFEYEISFKQMKNYFKDKKDFIDYKYSNNIQNKEINNFADLNFIIYLKKYLDKLNEENTNKNQIKFKFNDNLSLSSIESSTETNFKNFEQKIFCIPVLWNGCDIIKDMFINYKTKLKMNIIKEHYINCKKCKINDNNFKSIDINNKKIVFININSETDYKIFDEIIEKYNNIENYNIINNYKNIKLEKSKINIVACKNKTIYKDCFFILE